MEKSASGQPSYVFPNKHIASTRFFVRFAHRDGIWRVVNKFATTLYIYKFVGDVFFGVSARFHFVTNMLSDVLPVTNLIRLSHSLVLGTGTGCVCSASPRHASTSSATRLLRLPFPHINFICCVKCVSVHTDPTMRPMKAISCADPCAKDNAVRAFSLRNNNNNEMKIKTMKMFLMQWVYYSKNKFSRFEMNVLCLAHVFAACSMFTRLFNFLIWRIRVR